MLLLAGFLIIPSWFVFGYIYELMNQIIVYQKQPSLPEWDDWDKYLKNGFRAFAVGFIYGLPYTLLVIIPSISDALSLFQESQITKNIPNEFQSYTPYWTPLMWVGILLSFISSGFTVIGVTHMIAKDEFSAAFRIKELWAIFRSNISGYILSFIFVMGTSWVSMFVAYMLIFTIVLCCLYPFALLFVGLYIPLIGSVLFSQAYIEGVAKMTQGVE